MLNTTYEVNAPEVVSEVIDGELIIMDLQSGRYYSSENSGAVLWTWIEKGYGQIDLASLLNTHYLEADDDVDEKLNLFIDQLTENNLIRKKEEAELSAALPSPPDNLSRFTTPTLNVYTDMKDMLLLDPIHDVDETGWPMPKAEAG